MAPRIVSAAIPLAALAVGLGVGCASPPEARARGTWVDQQTPATPTQTPRPDFGSWDELHNLSSFVELGTVSPSEHLNGRFNARIWGSSPKPESGPFAVGAILVEGLQPLGSDRIDVYLAMIKGKPGFNPTSHDWEFLVVTSDGEIENRGPLPLCSRCHAEAPAESVFDFQNKSTN